MKRILNLFNGFQLPKWQLGTAKKQTQSLAIIESAPTSSATTEASSIATIPKSSNTSSSEHSSEKKTEIKKGNSGMFLHIMLKVSEIDRSAQFYTKALGLNLLREDKKPDAGYALAFVSFGKGNSDKHFEIQLTQIYNTQLVPQGNAFGNLTIAVTDVQKICDAVESNGGKVLREPTLRGDKMAAKIADPDGYQIEIINFK